MSSLTYAKYLDRVTGAWIGALAGAALGSHFAGQKQFAEAKFDKKLLSKSAPNDTTDLALLNLHALKERGPHLTSKALVEEWQQHFASDAYEFGIARRNWRLGIPPAASGRHNNDFFGESVSVAARAFVWGLVCPGAAKSAVRYARRDAELDHHGEAIEAAMFAAALMAGVFVESDLETLIHTSVHHIDGASRTARVVRDVLRWTSQRDREECIGLVRSRYATPDYSRGLANIGFILVSLIKAKAEFEASILGVAGCGYDASRTATLTGAITGALAGAAKLPEKWKRAIGNNLAMSSALKDLPTEPEFDALSEHTCRLGMEIASVFGTGVEFAQVPAKITILDHNPMYVKVMDVFIEYGGAPSLRFGEEREVRLKIVSRNPRRMQGVFRLDASKEVEIRPSAFPLDLGPYETRTVEAKVGFAKNAQRLPMTNVVTGSFVVGKEALHKETFGVTASAQWLAFGPFWQESRMKDKANAWTTSFSQDSGFDVKWLPEPEIDAKTTPKGHAFFDRIVIHADNDVIPLDHVFLPTGPCTVYLLAHVFAPNDRKAAIWLGCNDAVKLWVNKKLVVDGRGPAFFTPFNHVAGVKLNKSVNKVLLKVARSDRHFSVRIGFKEHGNDSLQSPWMTDLAFVRFELQ